MDVFALIAAPAALAGLVVFVVGSVTGRQNAAALGLLAVFVVWAAYGMGW